MPTYDYRCEQCGKMQITQRITEPALEECPTCHGPIKRIISRNVAVLFKGSGYYCKDNVAYTGKPLPGREEENLDNGFGEDSYEKVEAKAASPEKTENTNKAPDISSSSKQEKAI